MHNGFAHGQTNRYHPMAESPSAFADGEQKCLRGAK